MSSSERPIGLLKGGTISPTTMKQQAYDLLKDAILYRRLQIGITYSRDALCSELSISRTPVREALLELQQEGYIMFMRGKGIQVVPITQKRARDIIEARYHLEITGCRLAALRRTEENLANMKEYHRQLVETKCNDCDARTPYQIDRQFHREMFLAAGNTWMQEEIENVRDHFLRIETQPAFDIPEHAKQVVLEHQGILAAIEQGDEAAAEAAMRYHLDCTSNRTVKHIIDGLAD